MTRREPAALLSVASLTAVLLCSGCGGSDRPRDEVSFGVPTATRSVQTDVLTITEEPPGTLRLRVQVVGTAAGCVRRPRAEVVERSRRGLFLRALYDTSGAPACRQDRVRVVTAALGDHPRVVVVNDLPWRPGPGTSWVRCDRTLGCHPRVARR